MPSYFPRAQRRLRVVSVWLTIFTMLFAAPLQSLMANPLGGNVVAGSASIASSGSNLTVTQNSNRAIVNWQGFSIGQNETTTFIQPGANAAILNRVTGGNASAILGSMNANGQVYLINPNGVLFGPGANVNVGSLVVSTLNVDNGEFMNGGDLSFNGNSTAGVHNLGNLKAVDGDVYLIAQNVSNHGVIQAANGTAGLLAGQSATLVDGGRPYLKVTANSKSLSNASATNTGLIEAAQVELAANGGNVYGLAINNTGIVRATGAVEKDGRIYLTADGGDIESSGELIAKFGPRGGNVTVDAGEGTATVTGSIDVTGTEGGSAHVLGGEVALTGATIDASGTGGGGEILVGGDYQGQGEVRTAEHTTVDDATTLRAGALDVGDGGKVIVWADDTTNYAGTISARGGQLGGNGGFAEVSGKNSLGFYGFVDLTSSLGDSGWLLLDPVNAKLSNAATGPGNINISDLESVLNGGTNVLVTTEVLSPAVDPMEDGNITVAKDVEFSSSAHLELRAHRHIRVKADMTATGGGNITLVAGWDPTATGGSLSPTITGLGLDVEVYEGATPFTPTGANAGNYGKDNGAGFGSVFIDADNAGNSLAVSSVDGDVKAYGYNVNVVGGTSGGDYAMIGSQNGATLVDAKNNVNVSGGTAGNAFGQIGFNTHKFGGSDETLSTVTVVAGKDVNVTGYESFAQIGNLAEASVGDLVDDSTGNIGVSAGRDVNIIAIVEGTRAQVGHYSPLSMGHIDIAAGRDVQIEALASDTLAIAGHAYRSGDYDSPIFPAPTWIGLFGDVDVTAGRNFVVNAMNSMENIESALAQAGHYGELTPAEEIPQIDEPSFAKLKKNSGCEARHMDQGRHHHSLRRQDPNSRRR